MILDILDVEFCPSACTFHLTTFSLVDVLDVKACQGRANIWDTCVWKNERNNGTHLYEQIGVHKHSHTLLISLLMQDDATWCKTRKLKHGPWRGQAFHHQFWQGRSYSNVASKALRNDMALWHFQFWRQVTSRETWACGPCLTQIRKSMGVPHNDVKVSVTSVTSASTVIEYPWAPVSNNSEILSWQTRLLSHVLQNGVSNSQDHPRDDGVFYLWKPWKPCPCNSRVAVHAVQICTVVQLSFDDLVFDHQRSIQSRCPTSGIGRCQVDQVDQVALGNTDVGQVLLMNIHESWLQIQVRDPQFAAQTCKAHQN